MLMIKNLNVSYGEIQVLHDVSFTVPDQGFFGVLGANGAGKSTLLRTISRIIEPTSGEIELGGIDLVRQPAFKLPRLGVAHVPEGRHVFPSLTVLENLMIGNYTRRLGRERDEILTYIYDLFPRLKERTSQLAGSLSGGEQQMLVIGRALMLRPALLMLDEPSLGLAPIVVEEVFDRLSRIHKDWKLSILLIEQNATQALEVIDAAIVLENGRIVLSGTAEELLSTSYIQEAYLGL